MERSTVRDMDQQLPSDALTKPTRRAPWIIGGVAAVAIVGSAIGFGPAISAQLTPTPTATAVVDAPATEPTLTPDELSQIQEIAATQQAQVEAEAKAAADAAAAKAAADAAAQKAAQEQAAIHHCPAGTKAGAVDDAGNESNCQPLNSSGQSCQAYNDANQCTSWAALGVRRLLP